jgi:hypothetical protein
MLVIGAGVAGLSAIGTARSLGAIVRAFDPRSATRDQVKSMGAEFLELNVKEEGEGKGGYAKVMSDAFLQAEMALFAQQAMEVDIIITTALIPGKPAPKLITTGMVESMKAGSIIVILAAEQGGNCAMTEPGTVVRHKGVTIIGFTDLPSRMASLSSQLYSSTIVALLEEVRDADGNLKVDYEDQVARGALVIHNGTITYPPPTPPPPPEPGVATESPSASFTPIKTGESSNRIERFSVMARSGGRGAARRRLDRSGFQARTFHGLYARLFRRLAARLERQARAAHALDERDERHQRHHSGRRNAAIIRHGFFRHEHSRRNRRADCDNQHCGRIFGDESNAGDVSPIIEVFK